MVTRKPKSGDKWTTKELKSITSDWSNDRLSDGGGLEGRVKVNADSSVRVDFIYGYRWEGKKEWYSCSSFPKKSIADIRKLRDDAKHLLGKGVNPNLHKKTEKSRLKQEQIDILQREQDLKAQQITVKELFDTWIEDSLNRKDGNKSVKSLFNNHFLPTIGKIYIKDLSEKDLKQCYLKLANLEKYKTLQELYKSVNQMISWSMKRKQYRKLFDFENPNELVDTSKLIPSDYSSSRDRVLSDQELVRLSEIFKSNPISEVHQLAIWICLSCTCRIGELTLAEWKHLDFEKREWFIPAENTKGMEKKKTDHIVYLSDFALKLFKRLKSITGSSKWCFSSSQNDKPLSGSAISKGIGDRQIKFMNRTKKLSNRVENNNLVLGDQVWTVHDLRRTSATIIQKVSKADDKGIFISKRCLHHKTVTGVSERYLQNDYAPEMRIAWEGVGTYLESLLSGHLHLELIND